MYACIYSTGNNGPMIQLNREGLPHMYHLPITIIMFYSQVHQLQCRKKVMNSFTIVEQVHDLGHKLDQVLVLTAVIVDSV